MARYALIKGKTITNMIEWDGKSPYDPGKGVKVVAEKDIPKGMIYQPPTDSEADDAAVKPA